MTREETTPFCEHCGDTGLVRVHSPEDYGVSFESEACEYCGAGLQQLEPEEREARVQDVVRQALGYLDMTRCPYYENEGTCDRGCHSEPACVTDQPTEGWVLGAIQLLESVVAQEAEK